MGSRRPGFHLCMPSIANWCRFYLLFSLARQDHNPRIVAPSDTRTCPESHMNESGAVLSSVHLWVHMDKAS
jgi:hypothetical protein